MQKMDDRKNNKNTKMKNMEKQMNSSFLDRINSYLINYWCNYGIC